MYWSRIIRPAYLLMILWAVAAAVFTWLNLESLPDRIISGRGPGGLRYAPKEVLWFFPGLVLFLLGLGLFTEYLRRVSPGMVNLHGRARPGLERERNDLNRAMVAVFISWTGLVAGAGVVRLWLINTDQATPAAVFGWNGILQFVPLALFFVVYLILDRRYLIPKAGRADGPDA
jgi:hypothetical protein